MEHVLIMHNVKVTIAAVFAVLIASMGLLNIVKFVFHKDNEFLLNNNYTANPQRFDGAKLLLILELSKYFR